MPTNVAVDALTRAPFALVLTNPQLPDNPIVYVNRAFEEMTGYHSDIALGRNCRFLQGDDTDQLGVRKLREAIKNREEVTVILRNYRADGSKFMNRLMIAPLTDGEDQVPYFMGVQTVYTDDEPENEDTLQALAEVQHRVKNHLSMIIGMIRMQARGSKSTPQAEFDTLARRIETLQLLYEEMSDSTGDRNTGKDDIDLGAYLTRVANAIAYINGRQGVRVNIDADRVTVPIQTATQLGLVLSEVMTNAMQHAFEDRESGLVDVRLQELSDGMIRLHVADDGNGIPEGVEWPKSDSLGGRIVAELVRSLDAKISVDRDISGTMIVVDIPANHTVTE
ncbi:sensor histidine kinase [Sulfitobacter sp. THAF37]|uniref:sensor histidine kinase n=1 Tax=Sulfitobacter sp. THAF37 TaxID=2587855 RepID=UPI0012679257|nr:PAS domain-containing protein [Sulfitobacter sp. THAF37]